MDLESFEDTYRAMLRDPEVLSMQEFKHHMSSNTLSHCIYVTKVAGAIAHKTGMDVHEEELARGCMLHDFYLYSFKESDYSAYRHGTGHAAIALKNAEEKFDISDIERDMIWSHMWPLNLTHIPRCKESVLICIADKYCALREFMHLAPVFRAEQAAG